MVNLGTNAVYLIVEIRQHSNVKFMNYIPLIKREQEIKRNPSIFIYNCYENTGLVGGRSDSGHEETLVKMSV